jgi:uncharacterized protein (TIGR02421 family)
MDLKEIDRALSDVIRRIDFYSHINPVNREEEKGKFFDHLKREASYNPVFIYKRRDMKDELEELKKLRLGLKGKDFLQRIFIEKIDLTEKEIALLSAEDNNFTEKSTEIHGRPDERSIDLSKSILKDNKEDDTVPREETVTPGEMRSLLECEIRARGFEWRCVLSTKIVPKITVSGKDKAVYVNSRIKYIPEEMNRLVIHEIEVHVARGENGLSQPFRIFAEGLAGYDETEEGLAVFAEEKTGCLGTDTRQKRIYAARALSVAYSIEGSFCSAYKKIREFFSPEIAYRLVERVKRGMAKTEHPGCFTRDFHYMSGWMKLREYYTQRRNVKTLYAGKISLGDADEVSRLIEEGALSSPRYVPGWCSASAE